MASPLQSMHVRKIFTKHSSEEIHAYIVEYQNIA